MKLQIIGLCLISFLLSCAKSNEACNEKVIANCPIPEIYAPVCGCNGKEYENKYAAECNSIVEYTEGKCDIKAAVEGDWKLIAFWVSPGSSEPDFKEIDSDMVLKIKVNGAISSNYNICDILHRLDKSDSKATLNFDTNEININCSQALFNFRYEAPYFYILPSCFEGCSYKFAKK